MSNRSTATLIGVFVAGLLVGGGVIFAATRPTQAVPTPTPTAAAADGSDSGLIHLARALLAAAAPR
jgi:hypothetical protein